MNWKKLLIAIVLVLLAVLIVVTSLSVYVYLQYPGGNMVTIPLQSFILSEGMSSRWCEAMWISVDGTTMNASVLPNLPTPSSSARSIYIENVSAVLKSDEKISWTYYLIKGSEIKVKQCATVTPLLSFVFKGSKIDDRCIKLEDNFSFDVNDYNEWGSFKKLYRFADKPDCQKIILNRELVKSCSRTSQEVSETVQEDDYYQIYYWNQNEIQDSKVQAQVTLNRVEIDRSNSLYNCTMKSYCSMPLRYSSDDSVVGVLDQTSQSPQVKWGCTPRKTLYIICFLGVPVFFVFLLGVVYCLCTRKIFSSKKTPPTESDAEAEEEKRALLDEEALTNPNYSSITSESASSVLQQTGPIPGPYYPTAPSADGPIYPAPFPREPPPTYEESETQPRRTKVLVEA